MGNDIESILKKVEDRFRKKIEKEYTIEIGVIDGLSDERKDDDKVNIPESDTKPYTNAQLLYLNCMGSVPNKIPARNVLQYTIDDFNNFLYKEVTEELVNQINQSDIWEIEDTDRYMDKVAEMLGGHCRDLISNRDSRIQENSKTTIELKKSDTPLIDTGQMRRVIVGRVKK